MRRLWLPAAITLLAAALRFHDLSSTPPGLCFDEAANAVNFLNAIQSNRWQLFYPENNGREGLFINLQGLTVLAATAGHPDALEPWMMRAPSALFGALTVLALYLLARALALSRTAAAAAALMLATSFWHVNFSRIGFRAITAPFFLTTSLYLLFAGFNLLSANRRRALSLLAASGLAYGLGFHSYIAYRATPPLLLAALLWCFLQLRRQSQAALFPHAAAAFTLPALAAAAPLALYFLSHPGSFAGRAAQLSVLDSPHPAALLAENLWRTLLMFNLHGDDLWRHNISGAPQLFFPVGLLFLAGIALSLKNPAGRLALLWLALGLAPAALSSHGVPHALRALLAIPPAFLLAAIAADKLYAWLNSKASPFTAQCAAAAFAALLVFHCSTAYFSTFARAPQLDDMFDVQWVDLGREIRALPASAPKYLIVRGAKLDAHGIPDHLYPLAVTAGACTPQSRAQRNIHFVITQAEAQRVAQTPGAYPFVIN